MWAFRYWIHTIFTLLLQLLAIVDKVIGKEGDVERLNLDTF